MNPKAKPQIAVQALWVGIAGALLTATVADGAAAQAKYYPDGTNCALLSDAELVACQNQIYARQLESGLSQQAAEPAEVPSSHVNGNTTGLSDTVPGAEGTLPPPAAAPAGTPAALRSLPGPEGVPRGYRPTE